MNSAAAVAFSRARHELLQLRSQQYFRESLRQHAAGADRRMLWLLGVQWLGLMAAAWMIAPRTWRGTASSVNPHLWAAILAGPAFILPAIAAAFWRPGRTMTRHVVAVAQMLISIVLIDCTGGRIETHFHIFGSLAFLIFYRDWRVLLTASAVVVFDHLVRGFWWPLSIYGVADPGAWRWIEHTFWVAFEDFFLILLTRTTTTEMRAAADAKAALYEGASHDVLTGLANRRLLGDEFERTKERCTILFVDLDRFKQANDTLGHAAGDAILAEVARRLTSVLGVAGLVARVGGDEFVVLLRNTDDVEAARHLGQKLLAAFRMPFAIGDGQFKLNASVGISVCPAHGTKLSTLQENADRAMYFAKAAGRNRCAVFSEEIAAKEERMRQLFVDLGDALGRGEFVLHYQPVTNRNGRLEAFEALVRWKHPRFGMVSPAEFIEQAEKSGQILRLGDWVLEQACRTCLTWQREGATPVSVAVNVSAIQFEQPGYSERVAYLVEECGLSPALVTLEVTESVLFKNTPVMRANLRRLRKAGFRIALDDFGSGYCSLNYLSDVPADIVKLDRSFVSQAKRGSAAILESVIVLAHKLGLSIVAEGVETEEQRNFLLDRDCDFLQGFYFSAPVSSEDASAMVRNLGNQMLLDDTSTPLIAMAHNLSAQHAGR